MEIGVSELSQVSVRTRSWGGTKDIAVDDFEHKRYSESISECWERVGDSHIGNLCFLKQSIKFWLLKDMESWSSLGNWYEQS